ncbi:DEAD/DEAH box helicase [Mobiluncus curtisii]|uniref:DEAD/DEAH box helicase n=1 Tax=Mobiluncus curtisii TaxID=2051 RepID=UPI00146FF6C0|nr:DEAD/DEAH box helicase [Mobiluncus curtisii]NMW45945.1 DEAD/DEAH box helicase [Mobiluncus curtisii]
MADEMDWRAGLGSLLNASEVDFTNQPLAIQIDGETLIPLRLALSGEWTEKRATWRDLTSRWVSVTKGLNATQLVAMRHLFEHSAHAQLVKLSYLDATGLDLLEKCVTSGVTVYSDTTRTTVLCPTTRGSSQAVLVITPHEDGSVTVVARAENSVPGPRYETADTADADCQSLGTRLQVLRGRFVACTGIKAGVNEELHALAAAQSRWEIPAAQANDFWANYAKHLGELGMLSPDSMNLVQEHAFGTPQLCGLLRLHEMNPQLVEIRWTVRRRSATDTVEVPLDPNTADSEIQKAMHSVGSLGGWNASEIQTFFTKKFPIFELDRIRELIATINASQRAEVDISPELQHIQIFSDGPALDLRIDQIISPGQATSQSDEDAPDFAADFEGLPEDEPRGWGLRYGLDLGLRLGQEDLDTKEFLAALGRVERWWQTPEGNWVDLYAAKNQQLKRLIREFTDLGLNDFSGGADFSVGISNFGLVSALDALATTRHFSGDWEHAVNKLVDPPEVSTPALARGTWRGYQEDGFHWMMARATAGLGGILADDMGLGKTMQMLAVIAGQKQQLMDSPANAAGAVFVIVPASLMGTWEEQASRWFPDLHLYAQKTSVGKVAADWERVAREVKQADLVLTTYTLARMDIDFWQTQSFSGLVFDEAQFVKNPSTATHKALVRLRAKWAFALTGTPIENTATDLWSIMSLTVPTVLPSLSVFTRRFAAEALSDRGEAAAELSDRVAPFLLRRTKDSVAQELPEKIEQIVSIDLEPAQRTWYAKYLTAARAQVADANSPRINILTALTRLRQLALSAKLIDPQAHEDGAKVTYLLQTLEGLRDDSNLNPRQRHQALVFSQFTSFLAILRERLDQAGIDYAYLDGTSRDRDRQVARFQNGEVDVFLISLKAGGFGLNLTQADYVFLTDPWWNPAAEAQAVDRAHRLGQKRFVNVYRLVATDTIEQRVLELQEKKRDLIGAVLSGQENREVSAGITLDQLRSLLG